jgi:hypothetical protein
MRPPYPESDVIELINWVTTMPKGLSAGILEAVLMVVILN